MKAETNLRPTSRSRTQIRVVEKDGERRRSDHLATEEPLEIRLVAGGRKQTVAVTMRTPGADFELAAGFLFGEGVVTSREQIRHIRYCTDPDVDADQQFNIVTVELDPSMSLDLRSLERHFYTSSVCGVWAPSSLAVDLAREFGMTLIGFLRGERFNVYAGQERIRVSAHAT